MKHARKDYNRFQDPAGLIPEDEPVFLLRGQDVLAPGTLRFWANALRAKDGLRSTSAQLATLVDNWAHEMEIWQDLHKSKLPDLPPESILSSDSEPKPVGEEDVPVYFIERVSDNSWFSMQGGWTKHPDFAWQNTDRKKAYLFLSSLLTYAHEFPDCEITEHLFI